MTLLYGLLRLESDKRWYHLQRGSISVTGWNPPGCFVTSLWPAGYKSQKPRI